MKIVVTGGASGLGEALVARLAGRDPDPADLDFPQIDDGVRGMRFIERVVASSQQGAVWLEI